MKRHGAPREFSATAEYLDWYIGLLAA